MKLQIKTSILPMTRLGKIVKLFAREGKALEAHIGKLSINFKVLEGEPQDLSILYEIRSQTLRPIRSYYKEWVDLNLPESEPHQWTLTFPNAGMSEFRIYLENLSDEDVLLGDFSDEQVFKTKVHDGAPRANVRYYVYNMRIYSFYDLLLFFFALISGIGAFFEILSFFFK